jgi:tRNA(Met) cytidine acetyltransferase
MYEGDFDQDLSDAVYLGIRRPQGHLLAQSLTYHCALQDAATYRYARIVRIAVHPQCQRQGLGSQLLQHIIQSETEVDAIGTSFSATPEGLDFWQQNDFIPVRIGMSRHQASGEHSVMLLHPVSEAGRAVTAKARNRMLDALPYHLQEPLADLDRELVRRLADTEMVINDDLSDDDWQELVLFVQASRTYAEALAPLMKLADLVQREIGLEDLLTPQQRLLVIQKVLQHKPWEEVVASTGLHGQKQAIELLRGTYKRLLQYYGPEARQK